MRTRRVCTMQESASPQQDDDECASREICEREYQNCLKACKPAGESDEGEGLKEGWGKGCYLAWRDADFQSWIGSGSSACGKGKKEASIGATTLPFPALGSSGLSSPKIFIPQEAPPPAPPAAPKTVSLKNAAAADPVPAVIDAPGLSAREIEEDLELIRRRGANPLLPPEIDIWKRINRRYRAEAGSLCLSSSCP